MILNLSNLKKSDIKYKVSKFPDGQQNVNILLTEGDPIVLDFLNSDNLKKLDVVIYSRMNSFIDVELILCANASLRELGIKKISLNVPFFLGARSDRKFEDGGNNYLKDVICPIINSQHFDYVKVLDPHSNVLEMGLKRFKRDEITRKSFLKDILEKYISVKEKVVLIAPDKGATEKVYTVAKEFGFEQVITATKIRELSTGKIFCTEVPDLFKYSPDTIFIMIDDICDGGRTFIEIAKVIKEHTWNDGKKSFSGKIVLVVTHGIFSAGLKPLVEWIDLIYTTTSYFDIKNSEFRSHNERYLNKLYQYEIF